METGTTYFVTDHGTIIHTGMDYWAAKDYWQRRREALRPEHQQNVKLFAAEQVR